MIARRPWAWPLVPVYAAGLAVKDGLRAAGVLPVRRLQWPVVSVGSLSAGGAGKTPVAIALAELLSGRGWGVDVLSRGYGRSGAGVERADADAADAAERFGDEPVLIARRTGVPVWVGAERYKAGLAAEASVCAGLGGSKYGDSDSASQNDERRGRMHLLDDGFQHRGLARAVDVVLVTEQDLDDALLPAGNRRERLRALGRADVVVLREEERERVERRVRQRMREDAWVWAIARKLHFARDGRRGDELQRTQSSQRGPEGAQTLPVGLRLLAFCGIARPAGFWMMLAAAGCEMVGKVAFGDHHRYSAADVKRLVKTATECGATGFVTTEKDAVKLASDWELLAQLEAAGPLVVARLDAVFADEAGVVRDLEARTG